MYKIDGRVIKKDLTGIEILYRLVDKDSSLTVPMDKLIEIVKDEKVENCKIIEYNNKEYIKCIGFKLSTLKILNDDYNIEKVSIKSRVVKNNKLIGYIVVNKEGIEKEITTNEAWIMASYNGIEDVKAQIQGSNRYIVGINGTELKSKHTIYK